MPNLVLQLWGGLDNCGQCNITYTTVPGQESHAVLAGIPTSFTFFADGHDASTLVNFDSQPSIVLMTSPRGGPAVTVREFGAGRVVNFSHAANYITQETLQDGIIQQLYINAVERASGSNALTGTVLSNDSEAGGTLTYSDVESLAMIAAQHWEHSLMLGSPPVFVMTVQDLQDNHLALERNGTIIIDKDANGVGWFVDTTPYENSEFDIPLGDASFFATSSSVASDRYDLLSVILHELGHVLGYEHIDSGLMVEFLSPGIRRLPVADHIRQERNPADFRRHEGETGFSSRRDGSGDGVLENTTVVGGHFDENAFLTTFLYWFGRSTLDAPEFVDLNGDGGATIFDYPILAAYSRHSVNFPATLSLPESNPSIDAQRDEAPSIEEPLADQKLLSRAFAPIDFLMRQTAFSREIDQVKTGVSEPLEELLADDDLLAQLRLLT